MSKGADPCKYKVYEAEDMAFEGLLAAERPSHAEIVAQAEAVVESPWWKFNVGREVLVSHDTWGRDEDQAGSICWHRMPGRAEIAFSPSAPLNHITHELAHAAQSVASPGHGLQFRGWHVAIASAFFGPETGDTLRSAYAGLSMRSLTLDLPYIGPIHNVYADSTTRSGWDRPAIKPSYRSQGAIAL